MRSVNRFRSVSGTSDAKGFRFVNAQSQSFRSVSAQSQRFTISLLAVLTFCFACFRSHGCRWCGVKGASDEPRQAPATGALHRKLSRPRYHVLPALRKEHGGEYGVLANNVNAGGRRVASSPAAFRPMSVCLFSFALSFSLLLFFLSPFLQGCLTS